MNQAEQAFDKFIRNPLAAIAGVDKASFIAGFETCAEQRDELLAALKDVTRIVESFSYTTKLGKTQKERFDKARIAIAKAEAANSR